MKLKISTGNWFFRWAYLFTSQSRRDYMRMTTLCDLFWRAVLLTPLQIIGLSVPVVALTYAIAKNPRAFAMQAAAVLFGVIVLCLIVGAITWLEEHDPIETRPIAFIAEAYRGVKERYCPLVRVERAQ